MDQVVKRVEQKFFFNTLVYVRNQVVDALDMLMVTVQNQIQGDDHFISIDFTSNVKSAVDGEKEASARKHYIPKLIEEEEEEYVSSCASSDSFSVGKMRKISPTVKFESEVSSVSQWSVNMTYRSRPPDDCIAKSTLSTVSTAKAPRRRVLRVRRFGGSDQFDSFMGLVSLRDAIIVYSTLLGLGYGGWLLYEGFSYDVLRAKHAPITHVWPDTWRQLGLVLFGCINILCGITGISAALSRKLVIIHSNETLVSAIWSAVVVEAVTKSIRMVISLFFQRIPWNLEQTLFLRAIIIDLSIAAIDLLWYLGIIRSFRSVIVAGGKGAEFLPWILKSDDEDTLVPFADYIIGVNNNTPLDGRETLTAILQREANKGSSTCELRVYNMLKHQLRLVTRTLEDKTFKVGATVRYEYLIHGLMRVASLKTGGLAHASGLRAGDCILGIMIKDRVLGTIAELMDFIRNDSEESVLEFHVCTPPDTHPHKLYITLPLTRRRLEAEIQDIQFEAPYLVSQTKIDAATQTDLAISAEITS